MRLMALRTGVDRVRSESVHLTHGTVGVQKSAETRPKLSSEECRVRAAVGVAARALGSAVLSVVTTHVHGHVLRPPPSARHLGKQ